MQLSGRRLILWSFPVLAAGLALGWAWLAIRAAPPHYLLFIDWWTYALGSERALTGQSLYLPEQLAGAYRLPEVTPAGYIYPPPSALLFLPFALGPWGLYAWLALNVAVFFSGLAAVVRRELGSIGPFPLGFVLLGLLVVLPLPGGQVGAPFPNGVGSANVNVALAGLLAWAWAAGSQRRWIPYVAGLAGIFKIFPGVLALWAARRLGPRAVVVAALVAAAIALVTLPLVGVDEWRRFALALSNAQPACDEGRLSIACLALPIVGAAAAKLVGAAVGALLLLLAVVIRAEFPAFVLLTAGMLAPVTDGHQHYLLFVYVLLVIGACRLVADRRRHRLEGVR